MVRHVFLWRVAPGNDPEDIVRILNTLPDNVPGIIGWEIGQHRGDPGDSGDPWDGTLISDFESWDALEAYSNHPFHLEVVETLLPRFSARAVVDFDRQDH